MDDRSLYTDTPAAPATTGAEEVLVTAWQEILGVRPIGREDNFLELGGTSMLAVHLTARIERELGVRLPADRILAADTLAELALDFDHRRKEGK